MNAPLQPAVVVPWAARARIGLFRALERLSDLRGNAAADRFKLDAPPRPTPALWVYATTIGELNAVDPLLRALTARHPALRLVLITQHEHYGDAYLARWPAAAVCISLGHSDDARRLARSYPPALLALAEAPCLPSDAPARFSVAFLAEAKRRGATAVLLNGWIYGERPSCRMDAIERRLLQRDFVRAFDAICMQTAEGRDTVVAAGADPARVHVVGNVKFDAVQEPWDESRSRNAAILRWLREAGRPVVVAGCVTNVDEQRTVLAAFCSLRRQHASALLVLAPRHPENRERMQALARMLQECGLGACYRSALDAPPLPAGSDCLVLDTIGDLRDFYAGATVAHVGINHNVLEPMAHGKLVTVCPKWDRMYPSFPVYRMLLGARALFEAASAEALAGHWAAVVDDGEHGRLLGERSRAAVAAARGATARHLDVLSTLQPAAAAETA